MQANGAIDTTSQEAFPSLAPSTAATGGNKGPTSAWSVAGPRIRSTVPKQHLFTDSFSLSSAEIAAANKDGKPLSSGEVMRQVMSQYKVRLEESTNSRSRQTTFFLKSESERELEKAKRALLAHLSPVVCNGHVHCRVSAP